MKISEETLNQIIKNFNQELDDNFLNKFDLELENAEKINYLRI